VLRCSREFLGKNTSVTGPRSCCCVRLAVVSLTPSSAAASNRFGTFHFENGEMYNGWWRSGIRSGSGRSAFLGESYVGNYENDERSGEGTVEFGTGGSYKGGFRNGRPHGEYVLVVLKCLWFLFVCFFSLSDSLVLCRTLELSPDLSRPLLFF
jgi:hypothetical protein